MKKLKKFIAMILATIMVLFSFTAVLNKSEAWITNNGVDIDLIKEHIPPIYGQQMDKYQFNPIEILEIYALNVEGENANFKYAVPANQEGLIPVKAWEYDENNKLVIESDHWEDGRLDAVDSSVILGKLASASALVKGEKMTIEQRNKSFQDGVLDFSGSLVDNKKVDIDDIDDIVTYVTVIYPKVEGVTSGSESYIINTKTGITEEIVKKSEKYDEYNREIARTMARQELIENGKTEEDITKEEFEKKVDDYMDSCIQQSIQVEVVAPDKSHYKLVCGTDYNFYLEKTYQEPEKVPHTEFATDLSYTAVTEQNEKIDGKMDSDGKTFLPPYYDNDNSKKDTDAIATIKSKTEEDIIKVDGVDMKADGSANSEGWYYADVNNKKEISKRYAFDTYNNITYNGIINQIVKVEGALGGTDSQTIQIKWTFRRTKKETTENKDGSIKVTITYNLPIDTTKIPEGWEPIYDDAEKTTCHRITKTIKKGENYEKDVTVYQNGTGVPNTTHVVKIWSIPQAGESIVLIVAIIAVGAVLVITHKKIKRK